MRSRVSLFATLCIIISSALVLPLVVHAGGIPFFGPIIPPENPTCPLGWGALINVINNIISLLITLAIVFVAPLMIAYSGFLFVVNPVNSAGIGEAKEILRNTVVGIVIALSGWLIVDAIMAVLYHPTDSIRTTWSQLITSDGIACLKQEGALSGDTSNQVSNVPVLDVAIVQTPQSSVSVSEEGEGPAILPAIPAEKTVAIAKLDFTRLDEEEGNYHEYINTIDTSTKGYKNMDDEKNGLVANPPSPPYSEEHPIGPKTEEMIDKVDGDKTSTPAPSIRSSATSPSEPKRINNVDINLVKAIKQAESGNRADNRIINVARDGTESLGPMQVKISTAREMDKKGLSGLSDAQIREKLLTDHAYNVKIGTAYLRDLSAKFDGDLDKIIAAYNGGPGANKPSRHCPGSSRWQCKWDNKDHTISNTGYDETRDYVAKVNQYYSKLKKN